MEDIFTTAAESLPIEQIEQIEPSDLTVSNFKKILDEILPGVRSLAFNIVICILIYVIGSKVIALIKRMLTRALNRMQAESGLSHFLESAIDIVLHIFLIFMILGQLGVNTASIVTVLGTLMLAVGMSLQGSLSNVAGGILILLMHPFRVGHYIICDYGEGTVSAIGLVYTTLTTKDNRVLTIPNGQISNCAVTDCGENPVRRLDLIAGISYDSDLLSAKKILREICEVSPYVLKDREISVFVDSLSESSVDLGLFCYVESASFLAAKWEITEQIKLRFDEEGINIPFKTLELHMQKEKTTF